MLVTILTLFRLRISIVGDLNRCYNSGGPGPEEYLRVLALFVCERKRDRRRVRLNIQR